MPNLSGKPARRLGVRATAALTALALASSGVLVAFPATPALAAGTPDISLAKTGPGQILVGASARFTLTTSNPGGSATPAYNVTFRDVLPAGVSYSAGSTSPSDVGDPVIYPNSPGAGQTTLVWVNVNDAQPGGSSSLSYAVAPSPATYPVGSTFTNSATTYASSDPRQVAKFSAAGVVQPGTFTSNSGPAAATTNISAIAVTKSEPSPEHELLRGVHDNTTIYTLVVTNNAANPTNGVTLDDYIPAGLEFLGCGTVDNTPGGAVEYPGAPRLDAAPDVTTNCPAPIAVDTVLDPPGRAPGIYTKVSWTLGNFAGNQVTTVRYRAGIPLRENVMAFPGGKPTAVSLGQAANLVNNTGPETRETATAQAYTNAAVASGTYTGSVAAGTSTSVAAQDSVTVTAQDLSLQKSVTPVACAAGGIATYTLIAHTGEYRQASNIVLVDHLPDGLCPLSTTTNYTSGAPAECGATAGSDPIGASYATVVQQVDGSFFITFAPIATMASNTTTTVTFQARMRANFTSGTLTAAGDGFTNAVTLSGSSDPLSGPIKPDPNPPVTVNDSSSAGQSSTGPAIDKKVALRQAISPDCATATYIDPTASPDTRPAYREGDRICFSLKVTFPNANQSRNPVVTDVLPDTVAYEAGSWTTAGTNDLPGAQISFNTAPAAAGTEFPTWTLGKTIGGAKFVAPASTFEIRFAGTVIADSSGVTPDITGNLMKFRSENTAGVAVSLRDQVDFKISSAPPVSILKGVRDVNGLPAGGNAANTDGLAVKAGDVVTFRVDITNNGSVANLNNDPIQSSQTWDILPTGISCTTDISSISDSGVCTNPGDAGHPAGYPSASVIRWTLPAIDVVAAGSSRASLTYAMTIPANVSVSKTFLNTAAVRSYDSVPNTGTPNTHFPASNVDTSVPPASIDVPSASDTSSVSTPAAGVTKTGTTSITESNNNAATQATIGEDITYSVDLVIPSKTSAYEGIMIDTLPAGLTLTGQSGQFSATGLAAGLGALPGATTVTGAGSTVTLTLPTTFTNSGGTANLFRVTINARVSTVGASQGQVKTNTASFNSKTAVAGSALPTVSGSYAVTIVEPNPALAKSMNDADGIVTGGQVVTYTLSASNAAGRPPLHDSWVVDCVPNGLIFGAYGVPTQGSTVSAVAGDGTNGCGATTTRLAWNVGDITGGTTATLTYTATVTAAAAGAVSYQNTATLTGSTLNDGKASPVAPDNPTEKTYTRSSSQTLTVAGATVAKSVSPALRTIGQTATWTLTATLPSNVNFYDSAVIDVLPNGIDPLSISTTSVTCVFSDASACVVPGAYLTQTAGGGGTTNQGWLLGDVANDARTRTVTIIYTGKVADVVAAIRGAALVNSARVKWNTVNGPDPISASAVFTQQGPAATSTVTVQEPLVSIAKGVTDSTPEPGDVFTYTVTASNSAASNVSNAYNLVVTDVVPVGVVVNAATISAGGSISGAGVNGGGTITWNLTGPLAAGASQALTYNAKLAASSTLTNGSTLTNTASVPSYQGLPSGGRTYTGPSTTANVTPVFPKITPSKSTPGGSVAYVGTPLAWRVTLTNTGVGTAFGVDASDVLPPNWTYDAGSAQVSVAGGPTVVINPGISMSAGVQTLTWTNLGTLLAGQSIVINLTSTPQPAATTTPGSGASVKHVNTVSTSADDATGASANGSGSYAGLPASANATINRSDLVMSKGHTGATVAGSTVTWTLDVINAGPDASVGPFTVTDTLPVGVTGATASGSGWGCSTVALTVTCTRPGPPVAQGASLPTISVLATLIDSLADGTTMLNSATVTGSTFETNIVNNTDTDSITVVTRADLAIDKKLTSSVVAGAPVTYTLDVSNNGPSISRGPITVTDVIPSGLSKAVATGTGWSCVLSTGTMTCTHAADLGVGGAAGQITLTADLDSSYNSTLVNAADVTGPTSDPNPGNNSDSATSGTTTSADLAISKSHVGSMTPGTTNAYKFVVHNFGPSDAAAPVTVTDSLPAGLTFTGTWLDITGTWNCTGSTTVTCILVGDLVAGADAEVSIDVAIDSSVTGTIANTGTVDSATNDPDLSNNTDTESTSATGLADLAIAKKHSNVTVDAGTSMTYDVQVSNNGPSDSPGLITVVDTIPAGMTAMAAKGKGWTCTVTPSLVTCTSNNTIGAGGSAPVISIDVDVAADAGPATLINHATVSGPLTDPDLSNNEVDDPTDVVDSANVRITKKNASGSPQLAGSTVDFDLTVTNDGPSDADSVVVTDAIPSGLSVKSISAGGWTCTSVGTVMCSIPTLAAGASSVITISYDIASDVPDGTTITNLADVSTTTAGDSPKDNSDTADVTINTQADLSIIKSHVAVSVLAGDTTIFDIAVHNSGPSDAQPKVIVRDDLPPGMTYVSADVGWTCSPGPVVPSGQHVDCVLDGGAALSVGADAPNLAMTVLVAADAAAGTYDNTASVESGTKDPDSSNDKSTDSLVVGQLTNVSISKIHTGPVRIGQNVVFTLHVVNDGPSAAAAVRVVDTLPAGLTYVKYDGSGWSCAPSPSGPDTQLVCDWTGVLVPAAATDITVEATVDSSAYPSIDNVAVVTTTTPESNPKDNIAVDTVIVPPLVDLAITKSHRAALVVGTQATYDITVTNNGPTPDPGPVTVQDTLPTGLSYVSSSAGWNCTNSGQLVSCSLGSVLGATKGSNVATVSLVVDVLASAYPSVTNSATVVTASEDTDPSNDTAIDPAPVTPSIELSLTKRLRSYEASTAIYVIEVSNNGPNVMAIPIVVTDQLPSGLSFVSAGGTGWTCGEVARLVTCTFAPSLAVGATASFTVTSKVTAAAGETLTNVATITNAPSTDRVPSNNTDSADLTVASPNNGVLPHTGAEWGATILTALALLVVGSALVVSTHNARRMRRRPTA